MINLYSSGNRAGAGGGGGVFCATVTQTPLYDTVRCLRALASVCHTTAASQEAGRVIGRLQGDLSENSLFTIMPIRHGPIRTNETS